MPTDPAAMRLHRAGQGPALVLLHGIDDTSALWDGFAALARTFELITLDWPTDGAPCEIGDLSDTLGARLTEAGIVRAHVLGSGLGGMVALHFAASQPHRVDRLVLCDTSPALGEGSRDALLTRPDSGPLHAAMARADLMDMAEEVFCPTLVLCADSAPLDLRDGADFLARSIPRGQLAFVPDAPRGVARDRADWLAGVLAEFLAA